MGLPLSRFKILSRLLSGNENYARKLSRFKMVCIVLPDPYDSSFKRRMKNRFLALHEQTGKDMLFMTFVNPPKEWNGTKQSQTFQSIEKRNLCAEEDSEDKQLISLFIRTAAPNASIPAILVTDDLMSDRYVILETSISKFEHQLIEIGQFCTNSEARPRVTDDGFLELLDKLGRHQIARGNGARPLALLLADVFATQAHNYEHDSKSWAEERLTYLEKEMKTGGGEAAVAYYTYHSCIQKTKENLRRMNALSLSPDACDIRPDKGGERTRQKQGDELTDRPSSFYKQYKINVSTFKGFKYCEPLSKNEIDLFNQFLWGFQFTIKRNPSEEDLMYFDTEHTAVRDFSFMTCCLNKFMEREVNLSLVQQMRELYGIEMPEYYDRYKKNVKVEIKTKKNPVRLNDVEPQDQLKHLTLGPAMYAYETLSSSSSSPHIEAPLGDEFMTLWKSFCSGRNKGFHAQYTPEEIMNYPRFQEHYKVFMQILEKYLEKMMDIKVRLKG